LASVDDVDVEVDIDDLAQGREPLQLLPQDLELTPKPLAPAAAPPLPLAVVLEQARVQAEGADRARVRAEATSDTLRELLDAFRSSGQAAEDK